jgi:hypothetical protein
MKTFLFLSFLSVSTFIFTQTGYDIQPDRPGFGESSQVLRKGYLQIESGGNVSSLFTSLHLKNVAYNTTFLRLGLSDFFEFRFAWNLGQDFSSYKPIGSSTSVVNKSRVGFSPLSFGFKVKVFEGGGWIPSTALLGMMGIPNWASSHLTSFSFSPSILIPMEWDLSDDWLLTLNNGLFWDGEEINPSYFNSLGLDWMLMQRVGVFAEVYGNYDKINGLLPGFNGGIIWRAKENLQFDLSSGFGLAKEMPNGFINGGLSYRLNFNKH